MQKWPSKNNMASLNLQEAIKKKEKKKNFCEINNIFSRNWGLSGKASVTKV